MKIQTRRRALVAALLLIAATSVLGHTTPGAVARLDSTSSLQLSRVKGRVQATVVSGKRSAVTLALPLQAALSAASEYFAVGTQAIREPGHVYLVLVTQTPSNKASPTGYCGAGTEDVVHLVELVDNQRRMEQRDQVLLQSCLKTILLGDDDGVSLRARMEALHDPAHVQVAWQDHPEFGSAMKTIVVRQGSFAIE